MEKGYESKMGDIMKFIYGIFLLFMTLSHGTEKAGFVLIKDFQLSPDGQIKEVVKKFPKNIASETDQEFNEKIIRLKEKLRSTNKYEALYASKMLSAMKLPSKILKNIVSYYCDNNGISNAVKHKKNALIAKFSNVKHQSENLKLPDCTKEIEYFLKNPLKLEQDSYPLKQIKMFLFDFSYDWGQAVDGEIYYEFTTPAGEKSFDELLDFIYKRYDYTPDGKHWGVKK
ncbi:MAG: hypothetical protein NE334_14590 [Lentisphaeraceae bacterium]|nr:hypothetical protein [Lentisphaeraceae bacterium]